MSTIVLTGATGLIGWAVATDRLGAVVGHPVRMFVGEVAEIYAGQKRILPRKALERGFQCQFPTLDLALADLVPAICVSPLSRHASCKYSLATWA